MKNIKIIADDKIPFLRGVLEAYADIQYMPGNEIKPDNLKDADAMITRSRTQCKENLLAQSAIQFIASATIGFDHIDTDYCSENKISWTNAPGCNANSVKQYVLAALLQLATDQGFQLKEKTLGIIGLGNVGSRLAKAAKALGMRVLLNDPPRKDKEGLDNFISLKELLTEADIISFHIPLNKVGKYKTLNLADADFFNQIKKGSILINSSRGEIIDELALRQAIDSKKLKAVVLDVWRNEPEISRSLLSKINIATPHIAGYSADGKAKGTSMSVQALSKYFHWSIDDWEVKNIPLDKSVDLTIDCQNKTEQEILHEAYKYTYTILDDDSNLRKNPDLFESLRGNYGIRREEKAYHIHLKNNSFPKLKEIFHNLGFNLE
jgi:erythronate-4-phosphate dehydrogenase